MENGIDAGGLAIFLGQLIFIALIVERCVTQARNIVTNGLAKPWPLVATAVSAIIVFGAGLPLIPVITGTPLPHWIDGSILSLWIAGGASGIINTMKDVSKKKEELHQVKIGNGNKQE